MLDFELLFDSGAGRVATSLFAQLRRPSSLRTVCPSFQTFLAYSAKFLGTDFQTFLACQARGKMGHMKRTLTSVGVLLAGLLLLAVTAVPANAVRLIVVNGDCSDHGLTVQTRDGKGKKYKIAPHKSVNMPNGKRQVWVPSRTRVFKQYLGATKHCPDRPWKTNYGYGYWADFSYGPKIVFSLCPVNSKPACQMR